MELNHTELERIFWKSQEGKEILPPRLPLPAELAHGWRRRLIPLGDLYRKNPQIYVGYRVGDNMPPGDSGFLTYELWRRTKNSRAKNMSEALESLRNDSSISNPRIVDELNKINRDLALLSVVNKDIPSKPLILLNLNGGILPYTTGSSIEGTKRLLSLFEGLRMGTLGDHLSIDIIDGRIDPLLALGYNAVAFGFDNKPMSERVELLNERIEGNIDYSTTL